MSPNGLPDRPSFGTDGHSVLGFGTVDKTKASSPKETGLITSYFSIISGATRRNRTGDLLITKATLSSIFCGFLSSFFPNLLIPWDP